MKRFVTASLVLLCALAAAVPALAQENDKAPSAKSVQRLNRAPVNKDILQIKLPRPTEVKLSNGLQVLLLERHKLPTVNFALWINAGSLYDPKDAPGLAKFTAEMLREGTAHRSSAQLASEVDSLGATLEAESSFGSSYTAVSASGLAESSEKVLALMSDMVLNPAFASDELEKYKKRQLAELEEQRADPDFLAQERLYSALYGSHPASVIAPTTASVQALGSSKLQQFYRQYYLPNNALLGVAGDFDSKAMAALLEKYFGSWKGGALNPSLVGSVPAPAAHGVYLVDRPDSVQTNILAGELTVPRNNPDYIPLQVMNHVLGGGTTGRLFMNLREEKGYTYGAYSYIPGDNYPRPLLANTEVRTAVTDGSMHELLGEINRLSTEPVPETELDESRHAMVASFALSLESDRELLDAWMRVKHNGLPVDYWDRYPAEVAKVTPQELQRVAKKYLASDRLQVVCVGNGKEIKDVIAKYGPVEVYNVNGKKLSP